MDVRFIKIERPGVGDLARSYDKQAGNTRLFLTYGSHEAETTATAKTRNSSPGLGGAISLTKKVELILNQYPLQRTRNALVDDGFSRSLAVLEYKLLKRTQV